jgi:hypothetical protein
MMCNVNKGIKARAYFFIPGELFARFVKKAPLLKKARANGCRQKQDKRGGTIHAANLFHFTWTGRPCITVESDCRIGENCFCGFHPVTRNWRRISDLEKGGMNSYEKQFN